jgi:enoyl-CoA hydratase/carnithine racemase
LIGAKRVSEILMCNGTITAEQAVAWGFANRIIPAERIRQEALALAHGIAAMKPGSIGCIKRLLALAQGDPSSSPGPGLAARLEAERTHFVEQLVTEEARKGIAAFLEGRHK